MFDNDQLIDIGYAAIGLGVFMIAVAIVIAIFAVDWKAISELRAGGADDKAA